MNKKDNSPREIFKQFIEANEPYLVKTLKKRILKQKKDEKGALDYQDSIHVASYAIFYAAEDLYKSSKNMEKLTCVLLILTSILTLLTILLIVKF